MTALYSPVSPSRLDNMARGQDEEKNLLSQRKEPLLL